MKRFYLVFCLLIIGLSGFAQRLWIETDFKAEVINNLDITISPQLRFREALVLKEYFFDTNLEYGFLEYFELGAGYRFGYNINKDAEKNSFGRYNIDAKAKINLWNFQPNIRIRYTNAEDFGEESVDPVHYLRYKAELEYSIEKFRFEPYILFELYHNLMEKQVDKSRFEGGLVYKITKRHRIGTFYRHHDYLLSDKESINIIGINYRFNVN